jgi:uncharacterized protein (TIRG00374 family)
LHFENTYKNSAIILKNNKYLFWLLLKILITGGIFWLILNFVNIGEFKKILLEANVYLLAAAFLMSFLNIYLQYLKWKLTCNYVLNENNKKKIWFSLMHGLSAGAFTPARAGEYFGRAIVFKDRSFLQVSAAVIIDKLFPLLPIFLFGGMAVIPILNIYYHVQYYTIIFLIVGIGCLSSYIIYSKKNIKNYLNNFIDSSQRLSEIKIKLQALNGMDSAYFKKMIIFSTFFYLCFTVQFVILISAFTNSFAVGDFLWMGNAVMFAKTLVPPFTLGELGIREGISIFFLGKIGISASAALNASLMLFVINILIPSAAGVLFLFDKKNV